MHRRTASASAARDVRRVKEPIRAPSGAADDGSQWATPGATPPPLTSRLRRENEARNNEMGSNVRVAQAPRPPAHVSSSLSSLVVDPCVCDADRSLRCHDKLYAMLHNQIEIDPAEAQRIRAEHAAVAAERAKRAQVFGGDPASQTFDTSESSTSTAALQFHMSDFALGNLKNQSTRVVLPPTIIYSRSRPPEYFFTSVQTGGVLRRGRSKLTSARIFEDIVTFGKRNLSEAIANLGRRDERAEERAWEMEREEFTREVQFGSAAASRGANGRSARGTATNGQVVAPNLPHYMVTTRAPAKKSPLVTPHLASSLSSRSVRSSASSVGGPVKAQHPLTSSPSTPHVQHCDIIAQFTFSSDSPRYNDPFLPSTRLDPSSVLDPHAHPDILYLTVRSLHHFLHVVNADPHAPRATGVLQPFVRGAEERNTVYRVSFTAIDAMDSSRRSAAAVDDDTATPLPADFHVSIEARQNVLKLVDTSGTGPRARVEPTTSSATASARSLTPSTREFTLAERAATFDAAHLSLHVDGARIKEAALDAPRHVLHPRLPSELARTAAFLDTDSARSSRGPATIIVPSGYPFSPSAQTSAQRLCVPAALQSRLQAATLRMVSHVNELCRATERRARRQIELQANLQRELARGQLRPTAPPATHQSPNVSVGYLEVTFKVDQSNNLTLLTCRSLRHLVREHDGADGQSVHTYVRCAQCHRVCEHVADVLPVSRSTDPSRAGSRDDAVRSAAAAAHEEDDAADEYSTPFYARHGDDDDDLESEERDRRRRHALAGPPLHAQSSSALVFGGGRRRRSGDESTSRGAEAEDHDLWPESHFRPPPPPADRFSAVSDRIQTNPLMDETVDDRRHEAVDRNTKWYRGRTNVLHAPRNDADEELAVERAMRQLELDAHAASAAAVAATTTSARGGGGTAQRSSKRQTIAPSASSISVAAPSRLPTIASAALRRARAAYAESARHLASMRSASQPRLSARTGTGTAVAHAAGSTARKPHPPPKQATRPRPQSAVAPPAKTDSFDLAAASTRRTPPTHLHLQPSELQSQAKAFRFYNVHFAEGDEETNSRPAGNESLERIAALYPELSSAATRTTATDEWKRQAEDDDDDDEDQNDDDDDNPLPAHDPPRDCDVLSPSSADDALDPDQSLSVEIEEQQA